MDSLSQLALGAAVGVAVMGRRTAVWKAALWGGIAGTIPDLDALIDFGDAVRNMTFHRGHSHGLFWLTLGAPLLAWIASRAHGERAQFRRWWLALWLALFTHPLLDTMTVYGTQLAQPFSEHPFGVGSMFIIDPLYTVPLLVGLGIALGRRQWRGLRANGVALALSCAYLAWSAAAQWHVQQIARAELARQGIAASRVLVTPTAFNTVLWRIVAMRPDGTGFVEGFHGLLDRERRIVFDPFASDAALFAQLQPLWPVQRIAWFSRGFFKMHQEGDAALITDLRMGQEPGYVFSFKVAQRGADGRWQPVTPEGMGGRIDARRGLAWLWPRLLGQPLAPPR